MKHDAKRTGEWELNQWRRKKNQDLSYKEPVIYCCIIASKVSGLKQQKIYHLSLCGSEIWEQLTWVVRVRGLSRLYKQGMTWARGSTSKVIHTGVWLKT